MEMTYKPLLDDDVLILEKKEKTKSIVVYNDNVNTFEHVILCFIKYCEHNILQAEQCAHIIHNNGKCAVKNGSFDKLLPVCEALLDQGLTAKIEN